MSDQGNLGGYQTQLAERLQTAQPHEAKESWLDIESGTENLPGGCRWLVNLAESGEVLPLPALTSVPLTRPWFAGIANIRGTLFSVVDFSIWRGGEPTPRTAQARLLLMGVRAGTYSALLVQRAWGLRAGNDLQVVEKVGATETLAWQGERLQDASTSTCWTCLDIAALFADPNFLDVTR